MEILHSIFGSDLQAAFLIILNLVLIECLLSVDNAAVLATMVMDLPEKQ
jgi:predicted tellurium resistance membrane protein TerC